MFICDKIYVVFKQLDNKIIQMNVINLWATCSSLRNESFTDNVFDLELAQLNIIANVLGWSVRFATFSTDTYALHHHFGRREDDEIKFEYTKTKRKFLFN